MPLLFTCHCPTKRYTWPVSRGTTLLDLGKVPESGVIYRSWLEPPITTPQSYRARSLLHPVSSTGSPLSGGRTGHTSPACPRGGASLDRALKSWHVARRGAATAIRRRADGGYRQA